MNGEHTKPREALTADKRFGSTLALKAIIEQATRDHAVEFPEDRHCRPMAGYLCFVVHRMVENRFREWLTRNAT